MYKDRKPSPLPTIPSPDWDTAFAQVVAAGAPGVAYTMTAPEVSRFKSWARGRHGVPLFSIATADKIPSPGWIITTKRQRMAGAELVADKVASIKREVARMTGAPRPADPEDELL